MSLTNILDALAVRAAQTPARTAFRIAEDGERFAIELDYAEVLHRARAVASALQVHCSRGERVALLFLSGAGFVESFYGTLLAGMVAVPLPMAHHSKQLRASAAMAEDAATEVALTTRALRPLLHSFGVKVTLALEDVLEASTVLRASAEARASTAPMPTAADRDALAFIQYTSGSTSTPRGVTISHGQLVANLEGIRRQTDVSAATVSLSWLPHFHDMGLINGFLLPVYVGYPSLLMSPAAFLQRPGRWLRAIDRARVTYSGGPNFGYEETLRRFRPDESETLDLSCWRTAYVGSDPLSANTLQAFADRFGQYGLPSTAIFPCYGLAEATVAVTGSKPDIPYATRRVDRDALALGRVATPSTLGAAAQTLVSCGVPLPETQVVVVEPATGRLCADSEIGEVWVSGPAVSSGYYRNHEATERTFGATLSRAGEPPRFLRTGDLGFYSAGELFITGRIKDLLIIRGRNHYPHDLERTCEQAAPLLRTGCSIAFVSEEGEASIRLACESAVGFTQALLPQFTAACRAMRRAVAEEHGLSLGTVLFLPYGAVPKTSSGKPKRHELRESYMQHKLDVRFEG